MTWESPTGGYLIWLELHGYPEPLQLEAELARFGVAVKAGEIFFAAPRAGRRFLRLSISNLDESEITQGIQRLARGLRALA